MEILKMAKISDKMKRDNRNNNNLYQEQGKKSTQKRGKNKWENTETSEFDG